jgi:hypothetical protein
LARLVAVHGIAQERKGENTISQEWTPAILDGLNRVQYHGVTPSVAIAFYGDLFRPVGTMANCDPSHGPQHLTEPDEQELIVRWWSAAAQIDSQVMPPTAPTMTRTPQWIQRALKALSQFKFFVGMTDVMIARFIKQVHLYLHDPAIRQAAQARVEKAMSGETRILVGHSLGSVVGYEALCQHPEWPVQTFVTLGSPLGIRNIIFDHLKPSPQYGTGNWPAGIERWTNIADAGDIVALQKNLRECFGPGVEDVLVHNGSMAHDARPYLTAAETGSAIAAGL